MDCGLRWFVCFFCLCGCEEDLTSTWFTFWREDHQRYENLLDPKDTKPSEYCTKRYENLLDPRSRSKIRKPFGSKSYGGKLEVGSFRILAGKDFHQKDRRTGTDARLLIPKEFLWFLRNSYFSGPFRKESSFLFLRKIQSICTTIY
jgi:hypothetical protein